jgi:hypothetical protein
VLEEHKNYWWEQEQLGIGLTALISLPLAINELSEGARGSEAIQNTISDLTFGLTPRSDERIIKEIGGESAVKGMEIQKNIDDYSIHYTRNK